MKRTIYLAGSMSAKKNMGAGWRKHMSKYLEKFGVVVKNPCTNMHVWFDRVRENGYNSFFLYKEMARFGYAKLMSDIEKEDIGMIDESTDIIFYVDEKLFQSDGTIYELEHAFRTKKSMWFIVLMPLSDIPPWSFRRIIEYGYTNKRLFHGVSDFRRAFEESLG